MPGRAPRNGEARLSGRQSREAGKLLRERWTPQTVWSPEDKAVLTAEINAMLGAMGELRQYSTRKLEDWLSNARYRANCKTRSRDPESWSLENRAQARQKSRGTKQKQRRGETVAQLRGATAVAAAVPLVGWAAVPRVQDIRLHFETPAMAAPADATKPAADAGFGWPVATAQRPRAKSSESFEAIREKFERGQYGRTDMWASHRGESTAPSSAASSASSQGANGFEGQLLQAGARPVEVADELVPTFLSVPGLPLPPTIDSDADTSASDMQSSPELNPEPAINTPLDLDLDLDLDLAGMEFGLEQPLDDLDVKVQGVPVAPDQLLDRAAAPMDSMDETASPADELDDEMSWLADYASQSAGMLSSTVGDNAGSSYGLVHATSREPGAGAGSLERSVVGCTSSSSVETAADEVKLSPRCPALPTVIALHQPTAAVAAATVTATAVDFEFEQAVSILDSDLHTLLPAFEDGEVDDCSVPAACRAPATLPPGSHAVYASATAAAGCPHGSNRRHGPNGFDGTTSSSPAQLAVDQLIDD